MTEQDLIAASHHKHRKHSSIIVRVANSYKSDLGLISGQVPDIFFFFEFV